MRAFARTIMTIGWLLLAAGLAGPLFGLQGFNIFPGIFLLFIGRIFAKQAKQRDADVGASRPRPQRELNTDRQVPAPPPPRREPPRPTAPPAPVEKTSVASDEQELPGRDSIFESLLIAGGELAEENEAGADDVMEADAYTPMSSAEMIAEARRRWDRRQ